MFKLFYFNAYKHFEKKQNNRIWDNRKRSLRQSLNLRGFFIVSFNKKNSGYRAKFEKLFSSFGVRKSETNQKVENVHSIVFKTKKFNGKSPYSVEYVQLNYFWMIHFFHNSISQFSSKLLWKPKCCYRNRKFWLTGFLKGKYIVEITKILTLLQII